MLTSNKRPGNASHDSLGRAICAMPHIFQVFAKGMSDLANWQTKSLIYSVPADSCLPRGWMDTRTFRGRNDGRAI